MFQALKSRAAIARAWLFDQALPLWSAGGFDGASRCFYEKLCLDGAPAAGGSRVRVQARQTYVFAEAGRMGWSGPWRERVRDGVAVLSGRAARGDGGVISSLDGSGAPDDARRDLYDQAFAIFASAHAGAVLQDTSILARAQAHFAWVSAHWRHPSGGFHEGEIAAQSPRRQNPHMHLLEALLALFEATGDSGFLQEAQTLGALCWTRFMHAAGPVAEYLDEDLRPLAGDAGSIIEPGHQFEWCWLFDRLAVASGSDIPSQAFALLRFAEQYGLDAERAVALDEIWLDGRVKTATARLWPQTERLKANLVLVERTRDEGACASAIAAFDTIMRYLDTPTPGLWRDRMRADGSFVEEPAPASSFYHIMLAFSELERVARSL